KAPVEAFRVLAKQESGTEPLMRINYVNYCGWGHDELVRGKERFSRAHVQRVGPFWSLRWAGITEETILVVEALESGCPYQGHLAADSKPSIGSSDMPREPFVTIDEMRKASPTGEVFVNGQHDDAKAPKAVARSFLKATPQKAPNLDFFEGFEVNKKFGPS